MSVVNVGSNWTPKQWTQPIIYNYKLVTEVSDSKLTYEEIRHSEHTKWSLHGQLGSGYQSFKQELEPQRDQIVLNAEIRDLFLNDFYWAKNCSSVVILVQIGNSG